MGDVTTQARIEALEAQVVMLTQQLQNTQKWVFHHVHPGDYRPPDPRIASFINHNCSDWPEDYEFNMLPWGRNGTYDPQPWL